jgi:hypothetical protein
MQREEPVPPIVPPTSIAVPVCPHCAEVGITTPAERRTTDKVESKVYGKFFYVCPDAAAHPEKKFFLMESEWIKKQNFEAKRKALGMDAAPAADKKAKTTHPPAPPPLPNNAATNVPELQNFRDEMVKSTQIMLDLLVAVKALSKTLEGEHSDQQSAT